MAPMTITGLIVAKIITDYCFITFLWFRLSVSSLNYLLTDEMSGHGIRDQNVDDEASPEQKRQRFGKLN